MFDGTLGGCALSCLLAFLIACGLGIVFIVVEALFVFACLAWTGCVFVRDLCEALGLARIVGEEVGE